MVVDTFFTFCSLFVIHIQIKIFTPLDMNVAGFKDFCISFVSILQLSPAYLNHWFLNFGYHGLLMFWLLQTIYSFVVL